MELLQKSDPGAQYVYRLSEKLCRLGFHRSLLVFVKHLHLHCMVMPYKSGCKGALMFNRMVFADIDKVLAGFASTAKVVPKL